MHIFRGSNLQTVGSIFDHGLHRHSSASLHGDQSLPRLTLQRDMLRRPLGVCVCVYRRLRLYDECFCVSPASYRNVKGKLESYSEVASSSTYDVIPYSLGLSISSEPFVHFRRHVSRLLLRKLHTIPKIPLVSVKCS